MLGLLAALQNSGLTVQPFKSGPDYIDPALHAAVCGKSSYNLDTRLMHPNLVRSLFLLHGLGIGIALIEGAMGFYDGAADGSGSAWQLARTLKCPVVLILDASSAAQSCAATALGFCRYRRPSYIQGFILNNVGSASHAESTKQAVQAATGLPVLGIIHRDSALRLPERHLGLQDPSEYPGFREVVARLSDVVVKGFDLEALLRIARMAKVFPDALHLPWTVPPVKKTSTRPVIAVARDAAFRFYYQDNLEILTAYGAKLVPFSPLEDSVLPEGVAGIYFGGGYPELHAQRLSENSSMLKAVRDAVEAGMPVFGECGGYMYLCESLCNLQGNEFPMVGALSGRCSMTSRLARLGYHDAIVRSTTSYMTKGERLHGHCYHWSVHDGKKKQSHPAFMLGKPSGAFLEDGQVVNACTASYLHLHFASCPQFASSFVRSCREYSVTGSKQNPKGKDNEQ